MGRGGKKFFYLGMYVRGIKEHWALDLPRYRRICFNEFTGVGIIIMEQKLMRRLWK